jgi:uncharacterized protein (TIRG00374 family)
MHRDHNEFQRRSPFDLLGSTPLRRFAGIVVLVAGTYLLLPRLAGAAGSLRLVRQADSPYLLAAVALQVAAILGNDYLAYQAAPAFGPRLPFGFVVQVNLASQFTSMFIPSAGLSGLALRARYFRERGCGLETALLTYALEMLGQGIAVAITVALALLSLTVSGSGAPWWILLMLLATMLAGVAALAFLLARPRQGDWRYAVLEHANKAVLRLGRRPLPTVQIQERLGQVREAVFAISPPLRLRLLLAALARTAADIVCLQVTLLAFGQVVALQRTALGYALSSVLAYLSLLPGGLFVTEGSLLAILANEGVPVAMAVAATLTYRLFAFWMPRILGLLTFWNLQRQSKQPLW